MGLCTEYVGNREGVKKAHKMLTDSAVCLHEGGWGWGPKKLKKLADVLFEQPKAKSLKARIVLSR